MSSTSAANNQVSPIDFSTLKFSTPILDEDEDFEEENGDDDEYAFMKVSNPGSANSHTQRISNN